jgi:hypothetical protein
MGSTDPKTPVANGWLRASHRRLAGGADDDGRVVMACAPRGTVGPP